LPFERGHPRVASGEPERRSHMLVAMRETKPLAALEDLRLTVRVLLVGAGAGAAARREPPMNALGFGFALPRLGSEQRLRVSEHGAQFRIAMRATKPLAAILDDGEARLTIRTTAALA
jgi:hypothetical protein